VWYEYQKVAQEIHSLLPEGAISVEVYADALTTAETMLAQAEKLAAWFPGVFVKLPVTEAGLQVAHELSLRGIRINMTLCFSQDQAAAVHAATRGAQKNHVFVSPFIGRLDDKGVRGIDVVRNIEAMYRSWESPVMVLGASIRSLAHLYECFALGINSVTVPFSVLSEWMQAGMLVPEAVQHEGQDGLHPIAFKQFHEDASWKSYNIEHPLTDAGLQKFATDWKELFLQ
jgi:transaldolase